MTDVFISYSQKDKDFADKICSIFDKEGISYFIDRKGIAGGSDFPKVISNAILNSRVFLFLGSKNSYESLYASNEITFAFKVKNKKQILPYLIDETPLPPEFEFLFSSIQFRNAKIHPIETVIVKDIKMILEGQGNTGIGKEYFRSNYIKIIYLIALILASILAVVFGALYYKTISHKQSEEVGQEVEKALVQGHEYVDLGLSVKWATCNIGAEKPTNYGEYYAWGEIATKNDYNEDNYTVKESYAQLPIWIDVASSYWGPSWRIPTIDEWKELINNCKWEWSEKDYGYIITGENGNQIILPAGGIKSGTDVFDTKKLGSYLSSSLDQKSNNNIWRIYFDNTAKYWDSYYGKYYGHSIRPVTK